MSASWPTAEDVRLSGASRRHREEGGSPTRWQLVPVIRPCSDAGNHQSSLGRIPNREEKRTHTYKHKGTETLIRTLFVTSWFLNGVSRWIGWKGHLSVSDASTTSGLTHTHACTHQERHTLLLWVWKSLDLLINLLQRNNKVLLLSCYVEAISR